eukprot:854459-Pelagomonas_calceolata.AAC.2
MSSALTAHIHNTHPKTPITSPPTFHRRTHLLQVQAALIYQVRHLQPPHFFIDAQHAARREGHNRQPFSKARALQLRHKLGQLGMGAAAENDLQSFVDKRLCLTSSLDRKAPHPWPSGNVMPQSACNEELMHWLFIIASRAGKQGSLEACRAASLALKLTASGSYR